MISIFHLLGFFILTGVMFGLAAYGPEIEVSLNRRKERRSWKRSKRVPK